MLTRRSLIAIAAIFTLAVQSTPSQEYYRGGRLVPLAIDSNYIQIKFRAAVSDAEQQQYIDLIRRITDVLDNPLAHDSFLVCSLQTTVDFSGFLDSIRTLPVILHAEPYYMDEGGGPRLVSDRFVVSFVRGTSIHEIESINANYGVEIDHELQHMGGVYVLVNTPASGRDIVQVANLYYELDATNFSHPRFAVEGGLDSYRLFDEYHPYQYHLKKVIGEFNQAAVWDFAGLDDTITVAVLDDGIDRPWPYNNPDIDADRILQGYDFAYSDSDVTPAARQGHGTACASIIAANHATDSVEALTDTTGIFSMNPRALILPVRVGFDNDYILSQDSMAGVIMWTWKQGADVLSCSFSYSTKEGDDVLHVALDSAFRSGRNDKGCALVFSAGNDSADFPHSPGLDSSVIPVAAVKLNDSLWGYSNYASHRGLVAPSSDICLQGDVWALDRPSYLGVNPFVDSTGGCSCGFPVTWDCPDESPYNDEFVNCHFGGTSAACPVVAGTASLILAKDPDLTAPEVYEILRQSAVTELDWGTVTCPDSMYGYGRVDAFRAILSISHNGDVNNDGEGPDIGDLVWLVNYMFNGGPAPFPSVLLADVNCDGEIDIANLNYLVDYMLNDGPAPINPCFEFGD